MRLTRMEKGRRGPVDVVDPGSAFAPRCARVRDLGGYTKREVLVGREGDKSASCTGDRSPTPSCSRVTRTRALLGRTPVSSWTPKPGAEPVIVLGPSHMGDRIRRRPRHVRGQSGAVDGVSTRVVGIMPDGFWFPVAQEMPGFRCPRGALGALPPAGKEFVSLFARLEPGRDAHAGCGRSRTALLRPRLIARDGHPMQRDAGSR